MSMNIAESWQACSWRQGKGYDDSPNLFLYLGPFGQPHKVSFGNRKGEYLRTRTTIKFPFLFLVPKTFLIF
jgi:hypothetical protein